MDNRLETIQTLMSMADVQATHVSIYLTIVFGYIVVAYVAGSNLSRFQLAITTFIFVAACLWELMMITTLGQAAAVIGREIMQSGEVQPIINQMVRKCFSRVVWLSGMIAALVFTWNVRHEKNR